MQQKVYTDSVLNFEPVPRWIRIRQVTRRYSISRTFFYQLIADGVMPKAFHPTPSVSLWDQDELDATFRRLADEQRKVA